MQRDIDAIGKVGVTRRIGSSVLDELDERADEKIIELKPEDYNGQNGGYNDRNDKLSKHFQDVHESQFNKMDSLESHYINNSLPQTPKRHVENNDNQASSNSKKIKIPIPSSPPVNDITRKIRRLRLRNSLTGGNSNQSRTPSQAAVKNTPLTKQRPMDPPRFLKPTINSLNKNVDTQMALKKRGSRDAAPRGPTTSRNAQKEREQFRPPRPPPLPKERRQIPRSQSVFERLYSQTTISRSCSMGNVSVKSHSNGVPSRSREPESNSSTNITSANITSANITSANNSNNATRFNEGLNKTKMTRSRTSGSLSSQLDRPAWK